MNQREDYERTAYRRGLALTGDTAGARHVLRTLLARYDDILRVGESALARSAVQESRAWPLARESARAVASALWDPPAGPAHQLFRAVQTLPSQQREAWVLTNIDQLGDVDAARAMDCSRTALREVHLAGADSALKPLLGPAYDTATRTLRDALSKVDPGAAVADVRGELRGLVLRKRLLRFLMFLIFAAACATLWWVMSDLHHANEREIEKRRLYEADQQKFSLPMSPDEKSK